MKKSCDWQTGLVVEELSEEIESLKKVASLQKNIDELMERKEDLERQLTGSHDEADKKKFQEIRHLDEELGIHLTHYHQFFNPIWGPIMRSGQEESRLAGQIERYACIYMARISDLKENSPRHYYRPRRRPLPHELSLKK